MTSTINLAPIICLSVPERIGIIQSILDSIANDATKPELSEEMKAELTQRIAEYRANPELAIPWELAKARLLSACVS